MTSRHATRWNTRFSTIAAAGVLACSTVYAIEASAACFAGNGKGPIKPEGQVGGHLRPIAFGDSDSQEPVVGLWHAVFTAGGAVYDDTFQQFGSDGMENIVSSGLPPVLGNVCVGVWKQVGYRTYKLRHTTWNWSPGNNDFFGNDVPGVFAGRFEMVVVLRVSRDANSYTGNFVVRNFDTNDVPIPSLDAQGTVRGTRITVD